MTVKLAYIALGSNLATADFPEPLETVQAAINQLCSGGLTLGKVGRFYETEPIPRSNQKWYINTVAEFETSLDAHDTLAFCHRIEAFMGRQRSVPNAARVIDIDLVDFDRQVINPDETSGNTLIAPHPRMHLRAFVLRPLADIDPTWQHPILGQSIDQLIADLPEDQSLGQGIRLLAN